MSLDNACALNMYQTEAVAAAAHYLAPAGMLLQRHCGGIVLAVHWRVA